ncbi:MAG: DUF6445 family protein [Pseudomonadota bacterium]
MYKSFVMLDDFYPDPDRVRRLALEDDFPPVEGQITFPGRNSRKKFLIQGLDQVVSQVLGEPVTAADRPGAFHGHFRITQEGQSSRYDVHADPTYMWWVGLVYLNLPGQCQGGTAFFRHRALDSDRVPLHKEDLERVGVGSVAELLQRDGKDQNAWEHLMTVPMRYNRAVLYRPWMWHTATNGFGHSPEEARLIHLLAFCRPNPGPARAPNQNTGGTAGA